MTAQTLRSAKRLGRPPGKRQTLRTPSDFHRALLRIAEYKVASRSAGDLVATKTLYTINVERMASGSGANRLAAKAFMELAESAAAREQQLAKSQPRRPAYITTLAEQDEVPRQVNGRFQSGGASPNPNGRPKRQALPVPSDYRQRVLRIANEQVEIAINGKTVRLTQFEKRYFELGSGAKGGNRIACNDFIEMVLRAAALEQQLAKSAPVSINAYALRHLTDEEWEEQEARIDAYEILLEQNPALAQLSDKEIVRRITNLRLRGDAGDDGKVAP